MRRWAAAAIVAAAMVPGIAQAAAGLAEVLVELPEELRRIAGRGALSSVTHARVAISIPQGLDLSRPAPILVVNATSDRPYHSSRGLMRQYAPVAASRGWVAIAADPEPGVQLADDHASLRTSLAIAALAALRSQWPAEKASPLAFGGFSGGSKYTGWLAAAFAAQGRNVMGVYLSGCNENALLHAARAFEVLDEKFRKVPVFLQSGVNDTVATPEDHRRIARELERAGFVNVRIAAAPGGHEVNPELLGEALEWYASRAKRPSAP